MIAFPKGAVVVFGGSGGIGQGVAREFARVGCDVVVVYNAKREIAERCAETLRAMGTGALAIQCDVRDSNAVAALRDDAVAEFGRVHTIVWGAGPIVAQVAIADWTEAQFRQSVEIESFGFYNATRAFIPHFRANGGGTFLHLGSAGHTWWPQLDGLSVGPKAINEAMIKGIAKEEGINEIRANSILVGVIDAGQFKIGQEAGYFDDEWETRVKEQLLPIKRFGKTEDIGHTAVFLASDAGNYITGQTISVSGGFGI